MTGIMVINIDTEVQNKAALKAKRLGLSLGAYVSQLIDKDYQDPWGDIPPDVIQEWEKDTAEFEEEDRKHPRPSFGSGYEYVQYMKRKS